MFWFSACLWVQDGSLHRPTPAHGCMWGLMSVGATHMMVTPLVFIIDHHRRHTLDGGGHRHRLDGIGIIRLRIGMESVAPGTTGIIVGLMTGMVVGKTVS